MVRIAASTSQDCLTHKYQSRSAVGSHHKLHCLVGKSTNPTHGGASPVLQRQDRGVCGPFLEWWERLSQAPVVASMWGEVTGTPILSTLRAKGPCSSGPHHSGLGWQTGPQMFFPPSGPFISQVLTHGGLFYYSPFLLACRCVGIEYVNMENTSISREGNKYGYHPVFGIS